MLFVVSIVFQAAVVPAETREIHLRKPPKSAGVRGALFWARLAIQWILPQISQDVDMSTSLWM